MWGGVGAVVGAVAGGVQGDGPQISAKTLVDPPVLAVLRHRCLWRSMHPRLPLVRRHRLEPKRAYRSRRHPLQIPLRKPPIQPYDLYPRLPCGGDSERQQGVAGFMAGSVWDAAEGRVQEEVLHVDDDEGCFERVDGDGGCGCADAEAGGDGWGGWGWRVGEVEALGWVVEPEIRGVAEGGVARGVAGGGRHGGGEGVGGDGGGHCWWGGVGWDCG